MSRLWFRKPASIVVADGGLTLGRDTRSNSSDPHEDAKCGTKRQKKIRESFGNLRGRTW